MPYPTIIMFAVIIGMIFFMQRQQKKQAQERQKQLQAISKGDEVVTIGGLYAVVDEVDADNSKIVLDAEGVFLTFELSAIKQVITRAGQGNDLLVSDSSDDASQTLNSSTDVAVEAAIEE